MSFFLLGSERWRHFKDFHGPNKCKTHLYSKYSQYNIHIFYFTHSSSVSSSIFFLLMLLLGVMKLLLIFKTRFLSSLWAVKDHSTLKFKRMEAKWGHEALSSNKTTLKWKIWKFFLLTNTVLSEDNTCRIFFFLCVLPFFQSTFLFFFFVFYARICWSSLYLLCFCAKTKITWFLFFFWVLLVQFFFFCCFDCLI